MQVTITVSEPYTAVAGGWTSQRPVGQRRDYRANVLGRDFHNTSKAEIQRVIRQAIYRAETSAGFLHAPVAFTFVPESQEA